MITSHNTGIAGIHDDTRLWNQSLTTLSSTHQALLRRIDSGELWSIHHGSVIGRRSDCDVKLSHEAGISRHHARCRISPQGVLLEDLGSLNGTLVNNQLIPGPTVLQHGDIVVFDEEHYEFLWEPPLDLAAPDDATVLVKPPVNGSAVTADDHALHATPRPEIRVLANEPAHRQSHYDQAAIDAELDQTGVNDTGLDRLGLKRENLPQPPSPSHSASDPMASYADARRQVVRTAKERRNEIPRYARGKALGPNASSEKNSYKVRKYGFIVVVVTLLAALLYFMSTAI